MTFFLPPTNLIFKVATAFPFKVFVNSDLRYIYIFNLTCQISLAFYSLMLPWPLSTYQCFNFNGLCNLKGLSKATDAQIAIQKRTSKFDV